MENTAIWVTIVHRNFQRLSDFCARASEQQCRGTLVCIGGGYITSSLNSSFHRLRQVPCVGSACDGVLCFMTCNVPHSWNHGDTVASVRFKLLHRSHQLGISQKCAEWFIRWSRDVASSKLVQMSAFEDWVALHTSQERWRTSVHCIGSSRCIRGCRSEEFLRMSHSS